MYVTGHTVQVCMGGRCWYQLALWHSGHAHEQFIACTVLCCAVYWRTQAGTAGHTAPCFNPRYLPGWSFILLCFC